MYYVYIMASGFNGTLYVGVTGDLHRRVYEHREKVACGFTSRYTVTRLVWCEAFDDVNAAIQREKTIKKWRRDWKKNLIAGGNPDWADLFPGLGVP